MIAGLGGLVAGIYESMLVSYDWHGLMIAMRARLGVPMIYLRVTDGARDWAGSLGYPKRYDRIYEARYRSVDVLQQRSSTVPPMQPVRLSHLSRDPELEVSSHYRDIIRPLGIEHILTASGRSDDCGVTLSIARCADEAPFDDVDFAVFKTFAECFDGARRLREQIERGTGGPLAPEAVRLRRRYDLTRRQADVAVEVARGETIDAMARRLGVGREAVRAHLKAIYRKTGTHSRAELTHRLLTVTPAESPVLAN